MYAHTYQDNGFSNGLLRRVDTCAAPFANAMRFVRGRDPGLVVPATARWTFATRRVDRGEVASGDLRFAELRTGDLLLARIVSVGEHDRIQLAERRSVHCHAGEDIVLVVGNCYAPERFEGIATIDDDRCDLLAPAGIAGHVRFAEERCAPPTRLAPLARLLDANGAAINIARYALPPRSIPASTVVIGVFGTASAAGTGRVSTSLALGLTRAGHDVAVVRASGHGDFTDHEELDDTDTLASDITETGMASTYLEPLERVERAFDTLVGTAAEDGSAIVVVEFAHGLLHHESRRLLADSSIAERLDAAVLAADDAAGALGGAGVLGEYGHLPLAVSGRITASPLATVEAERTLPMPVCSPDELRDEALVSELLAPVLQPEAMAEVMSLREGTARPNVTTERDGRSTASPRAIAAA